MPMPRKYFRDERANKLICETYDSQPETVSLLAYELNVPRKQVIVWAAELGVNKQQPRWTPEDDHYLERLLPTTSIEDIMARTGRSFDSIRLRAKRLGINKRTTGYTLSSLCVALGCSHDKALRWIRLGWLRANRRHTANKTNDMIYISENAVLDFMRTHPGEIDLRRVDPLWFFETVFGGLGNLSQNEKESFSG